MICVWEQKHFPQTPDNSNIFLLAVFVAVIQFFTFRQIYLMTHSELWNSRQQHLRHVSAKCKLTASVASLTTGILESPRQLILSLDEMPGSPFHYENFKQNSFSFVSAAAKQTSAVAETNEPCCECC